MPEPREADHSPDGSRQLRTLRKVAGGVRCGPQRDHGAHLQVRMFLGRTEHVVWFRSKETERFVVQVSLWAVAGEGCGRRQPGEDPGGRADDANHRE